MMLPSSAGARDTAIALLTALETLTNEVVERARAHTERGKTIDVHQVLAERVAYAATETRAARALVEATSGVATPDPLLELTCAAAVSDLAGSVIARLTPLLDDLGLSDEFLERTFPAPLRTRMRQAGHESVFRAIGEVVAENRGRLPFPLDEMHAEVQKSVQKFAEKDVAPRAEHIHRHDELIPEELIGKMAELGYFGLSVPDKYGGHELGNLAMILTTEELSRASLAAAGSLITRPEILTKALLAGGSEAQKRTWLPKLSSGEIMVGISVTEPNVGSDVASLRCRAEPATVAGKSGWVISGQKAWCTFAGRADVLALLARTDPDLDKGPKGLSLFIVEKDRFLGHEFVMVQPGGGRMEGKADRTIGYRGMHSFSLSLENYFVPEENLVGEAAGLGKGFYLQMAGFAAGRLQTGGRACGVAQAALDHTARYVMDRRQFGRPIGEFPLTQYRLGRMAARLQTARAITYAAAQAMDTDERKAAPLAAQAKLLACDIAVEATQDGQVLHGGWGYAEEYAISRLVVDALVLPIFEGVKPVLELKVVARALLGD
jgi:(2S)-methylsuccinyl-CoA dehydrogenase